MRHIFAIVVAVSSATSLAAAAFDAPIGNAGFGEVTSLQSKIAPVAIVYSIASFMKNGGHVDATNRAYESLNFCGVKIHFVSESQLAAGKGKEYRMLVLPQCTHLTEDALRGLLSVPPGVALVALGYTPAKTPYGRELPTELTSAARQRIRGLDPAMDTKHLWPMTSNELAMVKSLPSVSVVDGNTGEPVWGVEWLPTAVGKRTVVNIINLTDKPIGVKLVSAGKEARTWDLLSYGGKSPARTLRPLIPVLAEMNR